MRWFGLDVHRDFCEVAIAEDDGGEIGGADPDAGGGRWSCSRRAWWRATSWRSRRRRGSRQDRLGPAAPRHPRRGRQHAQAASRSPRQGQDRPPGRPDAGAAAGLGLLDEVWTPDERTRALRRLTNRRERLVRARTRAKNEAHGVLARNLCERPPVTDAFGKAGRALAGRSSSCRPTSASRSTAACARSTSSTPRSRALDREIATQALAWPEVLRLMTVPGVNVQTAATFMASVGDIRRFSSPRKLVSYLGLDPRVRQSGNGPARHGRISKAGAPRPATCSARSPGR